MPNKDFFAALAEFETHEASGLNLSILTACTQAKEKYPHDHEVQHALDSIIFARTAYLQHIRGSITHTYSADEESAAYATLRAKNIFLEFPRITKGSAQ